MTKEFNKNIMFDNISFLLDKYDKKIGELEVEAGVSIGYISRTSKDSGAKPGIDFVINVAKSLNISVDTLISVNLSELTPTELYLISFFEKLKKDTLEDKLYWNLESADFLNKQEADINGYCYHPLLNLETFYIEGEDGYPQEITEVVMISKTFGKNTYIADDCFYLNMNNNSKLYVMNVEKGVEKLNQMNSVIEIWMYEPSLGNQFLGSSEGESNLADLIESLYKTIQEYSKYPKIKNEIQYIIDSYIDNDELDNNAYDDIPF